MDIKKKHNFFRGCVQPRISGRDLETSSASRSLADVHRRPANAALLTEKSLRPQVDFGNHRFIPLFDAKRKLNISEGMKYRPTEKKNRLLATYCYHKASFGEKTAAVFAIWREYFLDRAWSYSIVGAIILGMVSMSFIYRYLGPGALADSKRPELQGQPVAMAELKAAVLGAENENEEVKFNEAYYFEELLDGMIEGQKNSFENKIREMVKGYPIEAMVPEIASKDPVVAAFLVSIARKESLWGRRVPVLDGQDCYNYWGYRGVRRLMGTGGHTCFNSRKDAVDTVAKRIETLVREYKRDTPAEMVVWKCGSDCEATGGWAAAKKWIADVTFYFEKLNEEE